MLAKEETSVLETVRSSQKGKRKIQNMMSEKPVEGNISRQSVQIIPELVK